MAEVTRVPLQPIAKGSLTRLWLGIAAAILIAAGVAWAVMPAGVTVEEVQAGTGPSPTVGDVVFLRYKGKLDDGTVFDESSDAGWPLPGVFPEGQPLELAGVVPGFRDALLQMQRGGKYVAKIPGELAYGANPPPQSDIPPNADLTFEIELVDFMPVEEANQRAQTMQQMMQQMPPPTTDLPPGVR
ncbi:FKBP-type peptidyl-prolyl cis-trans isomerase FkpA [Altererythrobacter atlanticus]|uniref:Peptidyl-prolyl cis-trans isomerase n=1 Tax=Croceibacterium atlanticum TaxID=1267766 RepID=A0A0F7KTJ8_9SPHN|nr:FKBP-type peptidyl-prolyl cis-trans isomerase [Croceibacterium atlanticum]AKH42466.1 Peptidyl-prolyl cis-trans isomerase Mip precursor [Croceibacterium atlanticum]MBB5731243.1 FKBP-type peptidyl-prolyl cis-trans isomerase FkpA [Croceibacterium atlanticum]